MFSCLLCKNEFLYLARCCSKEKTIKIVDYENKKDDKIEINIVSDNKNIVDPPQRSASKTNGPVIVQLDKFSKIRKVTNENQNIKVIDNSEINTKLEAKELDSSKKSNITFSTNDLLKEESAKIIQEPGESKGNVLSFLTPEKKEPILVETTTKVVDSSGYSRERYYTDGSPIDLTHSNPPEKKEVYKMLPRFNPLENQMMRKRVTSSLNPNPILVPSPMLMLNKKESETTNFLIKISRKDSFTEEINPKSFRHLALSNRKESKTLTQLSHGMKPSSLIDKIYHIQSRDRVTSKCEATANINDLEVFIE